MTFYTYVGPADILARTNGTPQGTLIRDRGDLLAWDGFVTFVIDAAGDLHLADRHSEHVACAGGQPVQSAGELWLHGGTVREVSNQSTGYCPEPESWPAVAAALDRLGIAHPGRFTTALQFRLCPGCGERCIVKDAWFVCATCGSELPQAWNFTSRRPS